MNLARGVLGACALVYLALGAWLLARPQGLAAVGVDASTPPARTELRATYGGLELGLGLFLAWCLLGDVGRLRAGLWAAALTIGGFGAGRLVGLVVDRPPERVFLALLAVEVLGVVAAAAALARLPEATA